MLILCRSVQHMQANYIYTLHAQPTGLHTQYYRGGCLLWHVHVCVSEWSQKWCWVSHSLWYCTRYTTFACWYSCMCEFMHIEPITCHEFRLRDTTLSTYRSRYLVRLRERRSAPRRGHRWYFRKIKKTSRDKTLSMWLPQSSMWLPQLSMWLPQLPMWLPRLPSDRDKQSLIVLKHCTQFYRAIDM